MDKFSKIVMPIWKAVAVISVSLVILFYAFVLIGWIEYAWNVLSAWIK
jgi:hypothetical protein